MIVVSAVGWACFYFTFGKALDRISYDLPFVLRGDLATPEVCLVVIDEKSSRALSQSTNSLWNRHLHTQLVNTMAKEGARAVLFDIVFEASSPDPKIDEEFAKALAANGKVYLGASTRSVPGRLADEEQLIAPVPILRKASAGWGTLLLRPIDPDLGVREIYPGTEDVQSSTWKLARALGAKLPETPEPDLVRWINYYAPPGGMPSVGYNEALDPKTLEPGFFKDKIVIVGARQSVGNFDQQKDQYFTPYTRWGKPFSAGMEIHATILLNLLHHQWLERLDPAKEGWIVVIYGVLIGALLAFVCSYCPFRATGTAVVMMLLVVGVACWMVWNYHVWFNWLVPAVIQTPAALFWGVGTNYLLETRRRAAIKRAFSLYYSPHMANEIAEARFDLKPGGKLVEATVMFTDLKGFTSLSEAINDPIQLSEVMISYFNNTTKHVLENRGMIVKYMGDAVYALWGSPLTDKDHALHAVEAAWGMHQASQLNVHGHRLITRIGVNTGMVVAGNLGSDFRFDFTAIGDPVNLASRLEGLNKYLGTDVLLTETTFGRLNGKFVGRPLGRFILMGKTEPVELRELLGPAVTNIINNRMELFAEALALFQSGDLTKAKLAFEKTQAKSNGEDGPSEFYLKRITALEAKGMPKEWTGAVVLDSK